MDWQKSQSTEGSETVMMWLMTKILRVRGVLGLKMVQTLAGGRRGADRVSRVGGERGVCDDRPPLTSYSYHGHFDSENLIFMVSLMSSIHASIDMLTALQMQWNSHEISSLQCFVVNLKHAKMLFYWRLSLKISSMTWQFLCMHEKICIQQQYKTW